MRWLPRVAAMGIGLVLTVMGVGEVVIHSGILPRSGPDLAPRLCEGGFAVGDGCLYPKNVAWAIGFGLAGIWTIVAFALRKPAWTASAAGATAVAWVPYMAIFVPSIWGEVSLGKFLAGSANVIAFCLVAAPVLWWARSRELKHPGAGATS